MAKYASCSRAHGLQKGMPLTFTIAGRRQGIFVPLRTLHCCSCSLVVLIKRSSFLRYGSAAVSLRSATVRRAYRVDESSVSSKRRIFLAL
jgi:hypothetical protein